MIPAAGNGTVGVSAEVVSASAAWEALEAGREVARVLATGGDKDAGGDQSEAFQPPRWDGLIVDVEEDASGVRVVTLAHSSG